MHRILALGSQVAGAFMGLSSSLAFGIGLLVSIAVAGLSVLIAWRSWSPINLRLRIRSRVAANGAAVEVVITNRGRTGEIIDKLEVLSSDDNVVIPGVLYEGFPDSTFRALELSGKSSMRIVIEAPKSKPFKDDIKLLVGFNAGQERTIEPRRSAPASFGVASVLPSGTTGSGAQKKIRSPLAVLLFIVLVSFAIVVITGIVYLLLSGIVLKSHQVDFDFSRLERAALQILFFGIAIGVTAMAVIEVIKRTTPIRAAYHVAALSKRLGHDSYTLLRDIITARRRSVTFFDLPIEQLTGQIGAALDQIVANIEVIPIVWDPKLEQGTVNQPSPSIRQRLELLNAVVGRQFFVVTEEDQSTPSVAEKPSEQELQRDLETALRSALDAGLDNIQLSLGSGWKRLVRISAAFVSAASALAISILNGATYQIVLIAFLGAFIIGGFFSWLSRDLVAVVERWRQ